MATHGRARNLTISALQNREPFKRSGFAMTGVEGASASTGRMPHAEAELYKLHASCDEISYTVLSYATPIAYVTKDGKAHVPAVSYSPTTSGHQGLCLAYL